MKANADKFQIQTWHNGRYLVAYESHSREQAEHQYGKPYYRRTARRLVKVIHRVETLRRDGSGKP